jgi:hypothetical protein
MDGVELACRFSYITSSLHYCGPSSSAPALLRYIRQRDNAEEVRAALQKFEGLYAYLPAIGLVNNKDFLDYDVVEAYWIGNSLLDNLTDDDLKSIITTLATRGFPKSMAQERVESLPPGLVAHHDFNVLYMGVGLTSGKVEPTLASMENCRVSWGRVVEFHASNLIVKARRLQYINKKFVLSEEETRTVTYIPDMLGPVKKGDHVAIHWGFAPLVLTPQQLANLEKYTSRVREALNRSAAKLLGV